MDHAMQCGVRLACYGTSKFSSFVGCGDNFLHEFHHSELPESQNKGMVKDDISV